VVDVVIEFGHNDGGSPASSDRASVGGEGSETQTVRYLTEQTGSHKSSDKREQITLANGTVEVVQTFSTYLRRMVADVVAKGATPIVSGQTPNNPFE
jgi:rhamnogalacturonan acetylesterase